ncbi:MAG: hypothetical protein ACJAVV_000706 [Alphaproteobacteria bacterium]
MKHFLNNLLTGLTTVFAWTPATILLIMPFIGIYTGLVYLGEINTVTGILRLLLFCVITVLAFAGYLGLSAICWGLKLPARTKLPCLLSGVVALTSAIGIGYMSGNTLLQISFDIEEIYFFVSPLFFLLLHSGLEYRNNRK